MVFAERIRKMLSAVFDDKARNVKAPNRQVPAPPDPG